MANRAHTGRHPWNCKIRTPRNLAPSLQTNNKPGRELNPAGGTPYAARAVRGGVSGAPPSRRHSLRHSHEKLPVSVGRLAQAFRKLVKIGGLLTFAGPHKIVRCFPLQDVRQLRRFLTLIEKLVQGDFKSTRNLLQSLNGRDRVPVFNP